MVHSIASGFGRIDGQVHARGCVYDMRHPPLLCRDFRGLLPPLHNRRISHSSHTTDGHSGYGGGNSNESEIARRVPRRRLFLLAFFLRTLIQSMAERTSYFVPTMYCILYSHYRAQCNLTTLLRLAVKKIICLSLGVPREVISAGEEKYIVNHFASLRQNTIFTTASH